MGVASKGTVDELSHSSHIGILREPQSKPISSDQLATELKKIYASLVRLEAQCMAVDTVEMENADKGILPEDQAEWQKRIGLHCLLLYEHHDFLSASQHPAANESLRRLAKKYSMPARMWKHGIHSFLEVLRRRLPDSMDYLLQFIYTAYQMIALLYETVETFRMMWIECLGDLARYRMAIEEESPRDRETWSLVARTWYSMASDISPGVGRLYHHLGILARPNVIQQLCYYVRSLTCLQPFKNARESLWTLLGPALEAYRTGHALSYVHDSDSSLLYMHALMFKEFSGDGSLVVVQNHIDIVREQCIIKFQEQSNSPGWRWKSHGVFVAVANIGACFAYGSREDSNLLNLAFSHAAENASAWNIGSDTFQQSADLMLPLKLVLSYFTVALRRKGDYNVLPHVHVLLVFIRGITLVASKTAPVLGELLKLVPWTELAAFLNSLAKVETLSRKLFEAGSREDFMVGGNIQDSTRLPEDYSLRGLIWARGCFAESWFSNPQEEDTRYLEQASTDKARVQRVLLLGLSVSKACMRLSDYPISGATDYAQQAMAVNFLQFDVDRSVFLSPYGHKPSTATSNTTSKADLALAAQGSGALKIRAPSPFCGVGGLSNRETLRGCADSLTFAPARGATGKESFGTDVDGIRIAGEYDDNMQLEW